MTQRIIMIVLILVIALGGGFYAYNQLMPKEVQEAEGPIYSTEQVTKGDISVGVNTSGRLTETHGGGIRVPGDRYSGDSTSYVIKDILVEEGDPVKKDQLLVMLESPNIQLSLEEKMDQLQQKKEQLAEMTGVSVSEISTLDPSKGITLNAPISGSISNLNVTEGEEIEQGRIVARVVDNSRYRIRAKVNPAEYKKIKKDMRVVLSFEGFSGFNDAYITEINPNAVPDNKEEENAKGFVHWITIEGDNPGLIQPGMKPRIGIPSDEKNTSVTFFSNKGTVKEYIKEKRIINRADGVATEVFVYENQVVEKGEAIVSMAGSDTQNVIQEKFDEIMQLKSEVNKLSFKLNDLEIRASMDGIIGHINGQIGESKNAGDWIGSIYNTDKMMMWVQVDDIDVIHVKQDAEVEITVDALPNEIFKGKVMHVSTRGENNNGVTKYDVTIEVEGGPKLRPGMQANAYIDAGTAKNVLLVPLEAIFEEDNKSMVEILKTDGTIDLSPVKVGLMNDRYAEIKSGVKEGDQVVTGSSADILPSQHIKSNDTLLPSDKKEETDNKEDGNNEEK